MNFFRSLWNKLWEKYIDFVGVNPSDVYRATRDEFEPLFQPVNCRCVVEPVKMEDNGMLKLRYYKEGKLEFGYDKFDVEDDVAMELLCNKVNQVLMETSVEKERAISKLNVIKDVVGE